MSLKNYTRGYTRFQHPFMGYISPNCDHHCPTASSSPFPKLFRALHFSVEARFIPNCMKPVTELHNWRLHLPGRCVSALQEGLPCHTTAGARQSPSARVTLLGAAPAQPVAALLNNVLYHTFLNDYFSMNCQSLPSPLHSYLTILLPIPLRIERNRRGLPE